MANTFNFVVKNGITVGNTPVIASNGTYISAIANTGVQPGVYGNTSLIPIITVGADGRVTAISNTSITTSNTVPALVPYDDNFTGNGTTTAFTLSVSPVNANYVTVYVSGIAQQKSNYSLSGNVLTFNTAPPNGVSIEVVSIVASSGAFVGLTGTNIIANTVIYYNGSGYSSYSGSTLYANGAIGFSNLVSNISNTQITGLITSSQIANVANTQITGTINSSQLANTAVTAGTYGNYTNIPVITVNAQGQITSATNYAITFPASTAVFANSGQLTANSSTGNVLIGLATTGTAGVYGNTTYYPVITTDAYGRVTSVTNTVVGLVTTASYQVGSFGVGTAASGTSGEIRATNNITAYYSDDKLKTKLGPITNALDKVKSLNGFYYEANETAQELGYQPIREVGVSAQEVQAILPEIVVPAPISDKYLTVRYEKLIPLLIEAIKEQQEQIEDLLKRIK